jgi:alkylation response protein AidB-like acyl-CoA dehydrogenase
MYFDFSKEQYMARDSAREFLAERLSPTRLRALLDVDTGFDLGLWHGLAELGWMSVLVPEEQGGLGLGFLDLALLMEEAGRALVPAPVIETAVVLPLVLRAGSPAQRQRWLPRATTGDLVATVALGGKDGLPLPGGIGVRARRDGGDWVLDGEALLVPFADVADVVVTAARSEDGGVSVFVIDRTDRGVGREALVTLDPTMRAAAVSFDGVRAGGDRLVGDSGGGWPVLEPAMHAAWTAMALQAVGGTARALEMAVEYAKVRQQFGQPIGRFQAIKHMCADMLVRHETTRSGAWYAAWAVSTGAPDAAAAAAMAKALCTEAFRFVAGEAIQVHGGIGFTWEHDLHLYFKRAKALEFALGTPAQSRDAVAGWLARKD